MLVVREGGGAMVVVVTCGQEDGRAGVGGGHVWAEEREGRHWWSWLCVGRRMGGQVLVVVTCRQEDRRAGVGGGCMWTKDGKAGIGGGGGHVWAGG